MKNNYEKKGGMATIKAPKELLPKRIQESIKRIKQGFDNQEQVVVKSPGGKESKFVCNPITEQMPYESRELFDDCCDVLEYFVIEFVQKNETKILEAIQKGGKLVLFTEEDRCGAFLGGVMRSIGKSPESANVNPEIVKNINLGIARMDFGGVAGKMSGTFDMEYADGNLGVYGVQENDVVVIVEDMLSSGGTMASAIKTLLTKAKAQVLALITLGRKINYEGEKRIRKETDWTGPIVAIVNIDVDGVRSTVAGESPTIF